jgi:hypothetical protein
MSYEGIARAAYCGGGGVDGGGASHSASIGVENVTDPTPPSVIPLLASVIVVVYRHV